MAIPKPQAGRIGVKGEPGNMFGSWGSWHVLLDTGNRPFITFTIKMGAGGLSCVPYTLMFSQRSALANNRVE